MAKKNQMRVQFPLAGLNRKGAYRQQPPYTTYDCLNVWPTEPIDGRLRGGSRPGLAKSHPEDLGGEIRLLNSMTYTPGVSSTGTRDDGVFLSFNDSFESGELSDDWSQWLYHGRGPHVVESGRYYKWIIGDWGDSVGGSFFTSEAIDASKPVSIAARILPKDGVHGGAFQLFIGAQNSAISFGGAGHYLYVTLQVKDGDGTYSGAFWARTAGGTQTASLDTTTSFTSDEIGWLKLIVDGTSVKAYWRDALVLDETLLGAITWQTDGGFILSSDNWSASHECQVDGVRIQGHIDGQSTTVPYATGLRTMLIASAAGDLYYEKLYGTMEVVTSNLTLNSNQLLQSVQVGQKMYIADYGDLRISGDDGTVSGSDLDAASVADWTALSIDADDHVVVVSNVGGATTEQTYGISSIAAGAITLDSAPGDGTCTYRIERGPKVYDPDAGTLAAVTASTGVLPIGNPLMVRYIDRLVLAGAEIAPHVWYMSRQGDETDWDYSQTDVQAAVLGTSSEAGVPGKAITALVAYKDDYLIIGSSDELWVMRGDPLAGGKLDSISKIIGIIGPDAWCIGPKGEFIFLSANGVYVMPSISGGAQIMSFSDVVLPREFKNIDVSRVWPSLQYDVQHEGIHIFLTSKSDEPGDHWFLDWETKSYWPMGYTQDHEPTCSYLYLTTGVFGDGVIYGGRDGYLRRLDPQIEVDDGTAFSSYVSIGPIALGPDGRIGKILKMDAVVAENSGDVTWATRAGTTFEAAITSTTDTDTGTWTAGLNASDHPDCEGQAFMVKLTGESGVAWAFETAIVTIVDRGVRRLP
jgi:hypothetical protein